MPLEGVFHSRVSSKSHLHVQVTSYIILSKRLIQSGKIIGSPYAQANCDKRSAFVIRNRYANGTGISPESYFPLKTNSYVAHLIYGPDFLLSVIFQVGAWNARFYLCRRFLKLTRFNGTNPLARCRMYYGGDGNLYFAFSVNRARVMCVRRRVLCLLLRWRHARKETNHQSSSI